ncbi:MAG: DUF1724 domain-containing protein [Euryarchaeota archaeon]|nr:DUF1724 domain-containing protein [Euryarchaeota archaeon]
MNQEEIFELYDEVKDDLKFLASSNVRQKIMLSLSEGSKNLRTLRSEIDLSSSTILHSMNRLENKNLIFKKGDLYFLSQTGKIIILKLIDLTQTLVSIKRFMRLWSNHQMGAIPENLLEDIGCLCNSQLVESTTINIAKPQTTYFELLKNAKKIRAITPVFFPLHIDLIKELLEKDVQVELILTTEILDKLIEVTDQKKFRKALSAKNFTIRETNEEIRLTVVVTDYFIVLGLFSNDKTYDTSKLLIGKEKDAIDWGNKLFAHFKNKAEKFELE